MTRYNSIFNLPPSGAIRGEVEASLIIIIVKFYLGSKPSFPKFTNANMHIVVVMKGSLPPFVTGLIL